MQTHLELVHVPPPRVFHHSLDWRFLLPISEPERLLVAFEADQDFSETLAQVGIPVSNQVSSLDLGQWQRAGTLSFAFPFGLPTRWVGAKAGDQIEFLRSMRSMLGDEGCLLIGFDNTWNRNSRSPVFYRSCAPRQMMYRLQQAGFATIKLFGAMPDLRIPEYIFELDAHSMHFALQHRFRRKPFVRSTLQAASRLLGPAVLSNTFPCYFAVAVV